MGLLARPSGQAQLIEPVSGGRNRLEQTKEQERSNHPDLLSIPVIIISANRGPELATAMDKGICAFLPKPFDIGALTALIRSCIPAA